jgi:hypothetical protein
MSAIKFCDSMVKNYEQTAESSSDAVLQNHLFNHYAVMNPDQWADPMFRKWRRCVIVESLKRGLISKDPGMGLPERS